NGIIENYSQLRDELKKKGRTFSSETDTEIVAHLLDIEYHKTGDELKAIINTIAMLRGMFSLGIIFKHNRETLYAVKYGTPLVVGHGDSVSYIASDIHPLAGYAKTYAFLEDREIARLAPSSVEVFDADGKTVKKKQHALDISQEAFSKAGYRFYMEKEIHEQPQVIINTIQSRISGARDAVLLDDLPLDSQKLKNIKRVYIIACGTAWHAALTGKYLMEKFAKIPVEVDIASEFRYRQPLLDRDVLTILISQSGETADTLAAGREAKKHGSFVIAICNKPNSTMHRESDFTVFTEAGVEIGVAATKSFTAQISTLLLLSLHFSKLLGTMDDGKIKDTLEGFVKIPVILEGLMNISEEMGKIASRFIKARTFLFIGRGIHYPVALEGALKLKEITYIHAEGYAAGELKHGPIALVDDELVLIAVSPMDDLYEKSISNIEEVSARGGSVIAIGTEGDERLASISDVFIPLPRVSWEFLPILEAVPIQMLALNMAIKKGTDVDKPRNLAKSVTVE
ncbi:MAG: glutamine--fructose-6-phosphate transaminase (isomerizing), partial [Oligoflexia bacterium]|nr:glutamine--fructose-6-phosphate transaminase (isomerizing) [Oligoflexia bacterium]